MFLLQLACSPAAEILFVVCQTFGFYFSASWSSGSAVGDGHASLRDETVGILACLVRV